MAPNMFYFINREKSRSEVFNPNIIRQPKCRPKSHWLYMPQDHFSSAKRTLHIKPPSVIFSITADSRLTVGFIYPSPGVVDMSR